MKTDKMSLDENAAFERILRASAGKTVLVLGDVILDDYIDGDAKRISAEAPVPVVDFRSRWHVPGGAANVAANITALGCRALLGGVIGSDEEARCLQAVLEKHGVEARGLTADPHRPTTVKLRILARNQQIVRVDRELRTPISGSLENAFADWVEDHLSGSAVCILSDYGKGGVTARLARQVIALCRKADVPVLVDPKSLALASLNQATLIKPNKIEAERLVGREIHDESDFLEAGEQLAACLPGTAVLITQGALGMSLFRRDMAPCHVATAARNVYDVTGAGDTVISALAVALAGGASLEQAVQLATQSAALVVEKRGTATVTADELKKRWD